MPGIDLLGQRMGSCNNSHFIHKRLCLYTSFTQLEESIFPCTVRAPETALRSRETLYVVEQKSGNIAKLIRDGRITRIAKGLSNPRDLAMDVQGYPRGAETGAGHILALTGDF